MVSEDELIRTTGVPMSDLRAELTVRIRTIVPHGIESEWSDLLEQFVGQFRAYDAVIAYFEMWLMQPRGVALHHSNLRKTP